MLTVLYGRIYIERGLKMSFYFETFYRKINAFSHFYLKTQCVFARPSIMEGNQAKTITEGKMAKRK